LWSLEELRNLRDPPFVPDPEFTPLSLQRPERDSHVRSNPLRKSVALSRRAEGLPDPSFGKLSKRELHGLQLKAIERERFDNNLLRARFLVKQGRSVTPSATAN
jgi:hypothetical protein